MTERRLLSLQEAHLVVTNAGSVVIDQSSRSCPSYKLPLISLVRCIILMLCLDVPEFEFLEEVLTLLHAEELGQVSLAVAQVVDHLLKWLRVTIDKDLAALLLHGLIQVATGKQFGEE